VAGAAPIAQQTQTLQWLFLLALIAASVGTLVWLAMRLGLVASLQALALTFLAIMAVLTIRAAWMASYTHGDIARDMLIYVQTTPDVTNVVKRVEALSLRLTSGKDMVISYDDESSWPLVWYFRDFKNQRFDPKGPTTPPDAPVVIVGLNNDGRVKPLMGKYERTHLKLRWWFPEDYKAQNWFSLQTAINTLTNPIKRSELIRFFLFRELHDPTTGALVTNSQLGSTDFVVYVRKEYADSFWSGGPLVTKAQVTAAVGGVTEETYQQRTRTVANILAFGTRGNGNGQFYDPKGVTVDKEGNIYVADTLNHRIQKFDKAGKFLLAFGSKGEGDGQFNEPWGVAVDSQGNIFVADTWNHRIQKFDKDGRFITKWGNGLVDTRGLPDGQPSVFYGPRAIAIDKDDNLYVTDTGNKRIQKFDNTGKFLAQFGVVGTEPGQFNEPVGIALDKDGNIYVADTWNRRIQRFDSSFRFLNQWPVLGWESESIVNKPYLAVDNAGGVYVTDPELHRLIKFTTTGDVVAVWGQYGADATSLNLPIGIAVDGDGNIYVADTLNQRIVKFPPVR
jgi:sugar lactone lactonase YvrE